MHTSRLNVPPSFVGPHAKVRRAYRHIESLERSIERFLTSNPYRVFGEFDVKTGEYALYAYSVHAPASPPVVSWSVRVGEVVYHLRSALDQAVYELSREPGRSLRKTAFPIYRHGRRSASKSGRARFSLKDQKIAHLPFKYRRMIERMQPYDRRSAYPFFALWLLHEMNNADKHRTLVNIHPSTVDYAITGRTPEDFVEVFRGAPVYDGAEVGRMIPGVPIPHVNVEGYLATQVLFSETLAGLDEREVIPTLRWAASTVENVLFDLRRGELYRSVGWHRSPPIRQVR